MRWIPILLVVAACGTTTTFETDASARKDVVKALAARKGGPAVLQAGDRLYYIRRDALNGEIDSVVKLLSKEIARPENADVDVEVVSGSRGDVVAFAYPSRRLELVTDKGDVTLHRARMGGGTRYWAVAPLNERRVVGATAAGTPQLDRAWQQLEAAAASRSDRVGEPGEALYSMWYWSGRSAFLRDIGIDFRGLQGAK